MLRSKISSVILLLLSIATMAFGGTYSEQYIWNSVFDRTAKAAVLYALTGYVPGPHGNTSYSTNWILNQIYDPANKALRSGVVGGSDTTLRGRLVGDVAPLSGEVLGWNGSAWVPMTGVPADSSAYAFTAGISDTALFSWKADTANNSFWSFRVGKNPMADLYQDNIWYTYMEALPDTGASPDTTLVIRSVMWSGGSPTIVDVGWIDRFGYHGKFWGNIDTLGGFYWTDYLKSVEYDTLVGEIRKLGYERVLLSGTASVYPESTLVVGSGTIFLTELQVGDTIMIGRITHASKDVIANIISDDSLYLASGHTGGIERGSSLCKIAHNRIVAALTDSGYVGVARLRDLTVSAYSDNLFSVDYYGNVSGRSVSAQGITASTIITTPHIKSFNMLLESWREKEAGYDVGYFIFATLPNDTMLSIDGTGLWNKYDFYQETKRAFYMKDHLGDWKDYLWPRYEVNGKDITYFSIGDSSYQIWNNIYNNLLWELTADGIVYARTEVIADSFKLGSIWLKNARYAGGGDDSILVDSGSNTYYLLKK